MPRPLAGPRFQVLFHSPPGVLFTFPSRYYALSVAIEYSALEGGPPCFPRDSSCPVVLRNRRHDLGLRLRVRGSHPLPPAFPDRSAAQASAAGHPRAGPTTPGGRSLRVWALPLSLAATRGISIDFSSCRYLDGSLPCVSLPEGYVFASRTHALRHAGYPIRTPADHSYAAAPRGFSQLAASFIA